MSFRRDPHTGTILVYHYDKYGRTCHLDLVPENIKVRMCHVCAPVVYNRVRTGNAHPKDAVGTPVKTADVVEHEHLQHEPANAAETRIGARHEQCTRKPLMSAHNVLDGCCVDLGVRKRISVAGKRDMLPPNGRTHYERPQHAHQKLPYTPYTLHGNSPLLKWTRASIPA